MYGLTRLDKVKLKVRAIEALRLCKASHSWKDLSREFELPITTLSRYHKGHTLPVQERAEEMLRKCYDILTHDLRKSVKKYLKVQWERGVVWLEEQFIKDPIIHWWYNLSYQKNFGEVPIDCVYGVELRVYPLPYLFLVSMAFGGE
jgi:hypothetical protein